MVKLVALFASPRNAEDWMARFLTEDVALCRQLPGLERLEVASTIGGLGAPRRPRLRRRGDPPFLMLELSFATQEAFEMAFTTEEGQRLQRRLDAMDPVLFLTSVEDR